MRTLRLSTGARNGSSADSDGFGAFSGRFVERPLPRSRTGGVQGAGAHPAGEKRQEAASSCGTVANRTAGSRFPASAENW